MFGTYADWGSAHNQRVLRVGDAGTRRQGGLACEPSAKEVVEHFPPEGGAARNPKRGAHSENHRVLRAERRVCGKRFTIPSNTRTQSEQANDNVEIQE